MCRRSLEYFIEQEQQFIKEKGREPELIYNKEFGEFENETLPLDFLRKEPFSKYSKNLCFKDEYVNKEYNLSDLEYVIISMFLGDFSEFFRDDYTEYRESGIPQVVEEMQKILNDIILKFPKNTATILYRFLVPEDKRDLHIGEVYTPEYSLTTTIDDWEQNVDVYIITPLDENNTQAHEIFRLVFNQNENQVNFIKGTKFLVTDIKQKGDNKIFYLKELEKEEKQMNS
jgi:hypothetical protein